LLIDRGRILRDRADPAFRAALRVALDHRIDAWTPAEVETLTRLWTEGLTTERIAQHIPGRGRDAIIGKAHRLKLAPRPSPIKRSA
jgi:hypothetical protein